MEQIYYTQCPIGYGLGASNGYQIKRISEGYPVAGDFRHLGLKAFPGGGRTLAPPVLRYRREDDAGEVARLTPRSQEYQTERGLWGRPGGVFAHGIRLTLDELESIRHWPAGLFDGPAWRTTDPEPTRGRPPDDLEPTSLNSARSPEFTGVAPLIDGVDPGWMARVWTALAQVTREGRTLFLIDEPDRLAPLIALLTFGFPAALRGDLTFSTFHDRPEELPGYRIQGTSPIVRPNRLALLSQGIVADRLVGTIEPTVEPAAWARTLAGWFTRRNPVDEADWAATETRARQARKPGDPLDLTWSDAWLNPLAEFPAAYRDRGYPDSAIEWDRLRQLARWSGRAGVGDEWLRHRGPGWWLEGAGTLDPAQGPEARAALIAHAKLRDAWRSHDQARGWGEAVAVWFAPADREARVEAAQTLFAIAPRAARPSFAQALVRHLNPKQGADVLARFRADPAADRATLLPLDAGIRAGFLVQTIAEAEANDPLQPEVADATAAVRQIIADAASFPGAITASLDAVAAVANDHPGTLDRLAGAVAGAFDLHAADEGREALDWALRQETSAVAWLAPALRPRLADLGRGNLFALLLDRTPRDLWPRLARVVVTVADDPGLPDDAFRLAIERLVLPLAPRPHDPTWAEIYLRLTPSTWDLFSRLYKKEYNTLGLPAWLDQSRARGEISADQIARMDSIRQFARSLSSGDPQSLIDAPIPTGSPADRAPFLRQMLGRLGGDHREGLPMVLDACRAAWPGAFDSGAAGLASLAKPLAERLTIVGKSPRDWFAAVVPLLGRLGLTTASGGFEPDGLLAEIVAVLPSLPGIDPWPLRQFLFENAEAWPVLGATIRLDLGHVAAPEAPSLVDHWDSKIVKTAQPKILPGRFWEMILNAADPARLAAILPARVKDLQSLGPIHWWDHARHPGATDDLRDAYARAIPLDPLPTGRLPEVERWLEARGGKPTNFDEPIPLEEPIAEPARLSPAGRDRWLCLKALTSYGPTSTAASTTREAAYDLWRARLAVATLSPDEWYRWMGWAILGIDPTDPPTPERLAACLFGFGVTDAKRVSRWIEELKPINISAQTQMDRAGFVGNLGRIIRTMAEDAREARQRKA